jgi:hypothetical protein
MIKYSAEVEYKFQEICYLRTDKDQEIAIMIGYVIDSNGVMYTIRRGSYQSTHYWFELSRTKDHILTTTN